MKFKKVELIKEVSRLLLKEIRKYKKSLDTRGCKKKV